MPVSDQFYKDMNITKGLDYVFEYSIIWWWNIIINWIIYKF